MEEKEKDWKKRRKIDQLKGTDTTPELVLHRTLEKAGRIKSIAVAILWDNNAIDTDWSNALTSELNLMADVLKQHVFNSLWSPDDE
jgi:hypothetical protein